MMTFLTDRIVCGSGTCLWRGAFFRMARAAFTLQCPARSGLVLFVTFLVAHYFNEIQRGNKKADEDEHEPERRAECRL
jgi:hypothetical protein